MKSNTVGTIEKPISIFIVFIVCMVGVAAMGTPVENLQQRCTYNGATCSIASDSTNGVCRDIDYNTANGPLSIQICDKGTQYELVRQAAPAGDYSICVGSGCITQDQGFVAYTSTTLASVIQPVVTPVAAAVAPIVKALTQPTDPSAPNPALICTAVATSLLSPASIGFGGQTRADNYKQLVNAWFNSGNVIQTVPCSEGTCLWVPWYTSSSSCGQQDLQRGSNCNLGTVDMQNNCLVTDEFSQVGMALAMSDDQAHFDEWVNTAKSLKGSKYGLLPVWKAARTADGINTAYTKNQDDASDATSRTLIALYVASNSDYFSSAAKQQYKSFADALAADFVKYDFVKVCKPNAKGTQICNWLASGAATGTGKSLSSTDFSFGGYHGDAILALLAAYKSTGSETYLTMARDTVENYLLAAGYDGTSFKVPPKAFKWDTSGTVPKAVCTNNCQSSGWDNSDAVRAVSVCKAMYYASLNNVPLSSDLAAYCQQWVANSGVQSGKYSLQYYFGGSPMGAPTGGYYQNGLGAYLNFYLNQGDLKVKIDESMAHFDTKTQTMDHLPCFGVYRTTFPIVSLGSAIGRDTKAFGGVTTGTVCTDPGAVTTPVFTPPPIQTPVQTPTKTPTPVDSTGTGTSTIPTMTCNAYAGGPACTTISDSTSGGCRTMQFASPGTWTQVKTCQKPSGNEMYLQTPDASGATVVCADGHCVGPSNGFARW